MSTCENYWIYSHQTIRHEMYDGDGPSSQGEAMQGWHQLAERLSSVRHYVDTAVTGVQASQQGAAADAAVRAMNPLGAWVDEARRLAIDTGNKIDEQVGAFRTAKGSVPEVPPEPRGWSWKEIPVVDSFTTSDQEVDEAFNQEQERQARAAMASYQNGTNTRLVNLTQFAPPPSGEPNLAIPTGERSAIGGLPGAGAPGGNGAGGSGVAPGSPTTLAAVAGTAPAGPSATPGAPTGPLTGGTGGPEYPGGRPAAGMPEGSGGLLPGAPAVAGTGAAGSSRASRGGMRGGAAAQGSGSSGGRVPAGFGPQRGAGGFGPTGSSEPVVGRGAAASATGAGGTGAGGTGAGGTGAGGTGAGGAGGAGRGVGTGVSGGALPFGGTGAGGGSGGEDKERRRPSYLVESDSNRLVGDLPRTAPAVIGEDPSDHDESDRR